MELIHIYFTFSLWVSSTTSRNVRESESIYRCHWRVDCNFSTFFWWIEKIPNSGLTRYVLSDEFGQFFLLPLVEFCSSKCISLHQESDMDLMILMYRHTLPCGFTLLDNRGLMMTRALSKWRFITICGNILNGCDGALLGDRRGL